MPEIAEMGRVTAAAMIENCGDLWDAHQGTIPSTKVRRLQLNDVIVDTGATTLCLPTRYIEQLGLVSFGERTSMSSGGERKAKIYGPVKLTIQGRDCNVDVFEVPDEVPALIGYVPLELLDFVVDPRSQRLIGNPAHGGELMLDMF
jgi:predicted aspartyl protease